MFKFNDGPGAGVKESRRYCHHRMAEHQNVCEPSRRCFVVILRVIITRFFGIRFANSKPESEHLSPLTRAFRFARIKERSNSRQQSSRQPWPTRAPLACIMEQCLWQAIAVIGPGDKESASTAQTTNHLGRSGVWDEEKWCKTNAVKFF